MKSCTPNRSDSLSFDAAVWGDESGKNIRLSLRDSDTPVPRPMSQGGFKTYFVKSINNSFIHSFIHTGFMVWFGFDIGSKCFFFRQQFHYHVIMALGLGDGDSIPLIETINIGEHNLPVLYCYCSSVRSGKDKFHTFFVFGWLFFGHG